MRVHTCLFWAALCPPLAAHADPGPVLSAKLGKVQLQLEAQGQTCHIKSSLSDSPAQNLNLPWPCQFHLDKSGQPRIIRSGKFEYLMVESSKPLANSRDCETHLRAVRAMGQRWKISDAQDRVAACPPFQWDNMVFSGLFK